MINVSAAIQLRKEGNSYAEIGRIQHTSRQRIHQLISPIFKEIEYLGRIREKPMAKYKYYCFRCEDYFKSQLDFDEAICTKCGSSKISAT